MGEREPKLPKLSYVRGRLREVVTLDYNRLVNLLDEAFKHSFRCRHRCLVVLCGSDYLKLAGVASQLILNYVRLRNKVGLTGDVAVLHTYHDEFEDSRKIVSILRKVLKRFTTSIKFKVLKYELSERVLGTTQQILIMDLTHDLKPNDVGRLLGIVEGGGLIIFLTPRFDEWVNARTLFRSSLTVPRYPEPRSVFIRWFIRNLLSHDGIYVFDVDSGKLVKTSGLSKCVESGRKLELPEKTVFDVNLYRLALTQDQVMVIKLIEENFISRPSRHERITAIITADRGRGKSCVAGIAIVGVIRELLKVKNRVRVGVTAQSPSAIQSLMKLATVSLDVVGLKYRTIKKGGNVIEIKGDRFSIEYWQPLDIIKLKLDVLVVDEASGIAVPLLHKLWYKFKKTIFATTIHGYEGAGRGFSVRFLKRVREDPNTKLLEYEMREPIRYAEGDPVERFQFDVLLLDAEPCSLDENDLKYVEGGDYEYVELDPEYLFSEEGEALLRSLFGIYVLAHYRNEPDDLGILADAPHHSIRAIRLKSGKIVAASQLAEEGDIPESYIKDLLYGGKIAGNIIPDRLLKHLRREEFGRGLGWRVVRIAVHPQLQGRGIGSYLLRKVIEEAGRRGYCWVGSGYGVNKELLRFWLINGFKVVHISPDRNPVSGEYTVLAIYPLNDLWRELIEQSLKEFTVKLTESLHDVYRDLEPDVAYLLLTQLTSEIGTHVLDLTKVQLERVKAYCMGLMTYETVCDAVSILFKRLIYSGGLRQLSEEEGSLMISKVLQGLPWQSVAELLRGEKSRYASAVRKIVVKLLWITYNLRIESS
ncbi:MAG: tRNA(Met) cytidine acetyltransferase TmcA [Sulfolobales archaeon]